MKTPAMTIPYDVHCVQKNTHSRFLPGKFLDLHRIFRECVR